MTATAVRPDSMSIAELTRAVFGEAMSIDGVLARVGLSTSPTANATAAPAPLWVGSVGYERHRDNLEFAAHVRAAGVERLIDVRELPISRRRGYAKTALASAMASVGVEYIHMRSLGNPKPFRDMYKSGRVEEGRRCYQHHLLTEGLDALGALVPLLREKPSALMCVEHDSATCHRTVIMDALRSELGLSLQVAEIA